MNGTRLKVISSDSPETFEFEVNRFLSELDTQGLPYDLSFCNADKHCVYVSFSNPKLKVPVKEDGRGDLCARHCPEFNRDHPGCNAYCNLHKRRIEFGGFCCSEYYERLKRGDRQ
jgi:hypothetical protein